MAAEKAESARVNLAAKLEGSDLRVVPLNRVTVSAVAAKKSSAT
jgi:hypothetical protein